MNKYREQRDGFFTTYCNIKTGEIKFRLSEGDVLVAASTDDFMRENAQIRR